MSSSSRFAGFAAIVACLAVAAPAVADEIEVCADAAEKGQELRDASKLVEARERLVRCAQSTCPKMIRTDCEKWLPEIEARIPTVVLHATDESGGDLSSVKVERDGAAWLERLDGAAIPMNPGATKLRFSAQGFSPLEKELVVVEGQRGRIIEVSLKREGGETKPPSAEPAAAGTTESAGVGPLPWIALGVGAAGLGTFAVTQILASSDVADVEDGCGKTKTCTDADLDPIRTELTVSAIGLGVGIAGVGASIALFALLSGGDTSAETTSLRVTPILGPTTAAACVDVPLTF